MTHEKHQYISYPGHGIGRITSTESRHDVEFINIQILSSDLKITIPKESLHCYRPLMSLEVAMQVQELLKEPNGIVFVANDRTWNRRYDRLMKKFKSNDPVKMAEIVAELNNRKAAGELSYGERKLLDGVKKLLEVELDLVVDLPRGV